MNISKMAIEELIPAEYNPRKDLQPGDIEYEKLKRSIETFGYIEPVIINDRTGIVVGGHQRLKVLRDLGYKEIEVVHVDLDNTNEKALNIALNKINGEWDTEKLENIIKDLNNNNPDFDLTLTGFDNIDLSSILDYDNITLNESDAELLFRDRTPEEEERANKIYIKTPKYKIEVQEEELEAFESIIKQYKDANNTLYNFFAEVVRRWDIE